MTNDKPAVDLTFQQQNGPNNDNNNNEPKVELINGRNVFVWNSGMTGSQSKVKVLEDFAKQYPGSRVTVIFTSTGGGVDDCRESYNRMLMMRTLYNMHFTFVILEAKSCALWFVQCADVRVALPHSALMYHCVRWSLSGAKSQRELDEAKQGMEKNQREFTTILCSRSSESEKVLEATMTLIDDGQDHIITPQQALENGWIDTIYQPKFVKFEGEVDLGGLNLSSTQN
jgi:ATP-dependent protease ClpP protease subunit